MDFEPSDTQRLLSESLARRLESRRGVVPRGPRGWDADVWRTLRELGVPALPYDEAVGGHGGDGVDLMLVCYELARALAVTPFAASVVQAGRAVALATGGGARRPMLAALASGDAIAAWAHREPDHRHDPVPVATRADAVGGAWRLTGRKVDVAFADESTWLMVTACIDRDGGPAGLFAIERRADGVEVRASRRIDGTPCGRIDLRAATATRLSADGDDVGAIIAAVEDRAAAAAAGDALGSMDEAMRLTLAHLRTRRQFGVPIGSFQALQHRAADLQVALEQARGMAMYAAVHADSASPHERAASVSAAKIVVGRAAQRIGDGAIQLHGGIGMTEEYAVGHHARRLAVFRASHGDEAFHARRLASLMRSIEFP